MDDDRGSDERGPAGAWPRRRFLHATAVAGAGLVAGWPAGGWGRRAEGESFFVISDTHFRAEREAPARAAPDSVAVNRRLLEWLNGLPGQRLPGELGGGAVAEPRGVIHLGDMVDTGDRYGGVNEQMAATEWDVYRDHVGLTGREGLLRYPIYEIHGNHDTPRQRNAALEGVIERNARRGGLAAISPNGLHYSWDWGPLHFIALGIVVGPNAVDRQVSRYEAFESLSFLQHDLATHVGRSGRPVVLLHHVDLQRYSVPCGDEGIGGSRAMCCEGMRLVAWHSRDCPENSPGISLREWSACDVRAYHDALRGYNVAAIFHGHLHARRIDTWDGQVVNAPQGIPVFGAKNAGAGGANRAFFYCRVEDGDLVVRECQSLGEHGWDPERSQIRWETTAWRAPLRLG
jgi:hypothetical protein